METQDVNQMLKTLSEYNRGQHPDYQTDRAELDNKIKNLKDSIESHIGTKTDIAQYEEKVKEQTKELKKEFEKKYADLKANLWNQVVEIINKKHGVENNPKTPTLWHKAYEMGHASGHAEIVSYFEELVELIK